MFTFGVKSVYYSFWDSWDIERKRVNKLNPNGRFNFLSNKVLWLKVFEWSFVALITYIWDWRVGVFFVSHAYIQSFLLEIINYIEHYGLRRKEIAPGKYERTTIRHSWNAAHRWSNAFLVKLQRHSDHHENAFKPY